MTTDTLEIRPATRDDNAYIKQMILDVLDEYGVEADLAYDDLDAVEFGLNDTRFYFVCEIGDIVVGSAILTPESDTVYKLTKLFLPKAYRGKGIGKAMLAFVTEFTKNKGVQEVYLRTRDKYKEACALYDSTGWTRHPHDIPPPGAPVKYYINPQA